MVDFGHGYQPELYPKRELAVKRTASARCRAHHPTLSRVRLVKLAGVAAT